MSISLYELYSLKTIIIGKEYVGKTSITNKLLNKVPVSIEPTIGASFQILKHNGIRYDIWDTAGQERYLSIVRMFYLGAQIVLLVYDLSDLSTIERISYHLIKLEQMFNADQIRIIIIGNKLDMVEDTTKAEELVDDIISHSMYQKNMSHCLTSTVDGSGMKTLFDKLGEYGQSIKINHEYENVELDEKPVILNTPQTYYEQYVKGIRCII
jgi:Ras-related protein Rab-5C